MCARFCSSVPKSSRVGARMEKVGVLNTTGIS